MIAGCPGQRCSTTRTSLVPCLCVAALWLASCDGSPSPLTVAARGAALGCPITPSTTVTFYGETGTGGVESHSRSWVIHFLDWWRAHDPAVEPVELKAAELTGGCALTSYPGLRLHIQPGGNAYDQQATLGAAGRATINAYLDQGGAYLGICAGFYYAASDYYWKGTLYAWPHLLGRFPTVEGEITAIADFDQPPGYAVTGVSSGHRMLYYGGPTRGLAKTALGHPGQTLLTYTAVPGQLPAAIRHGKLLLSSVHPEAFEGDGITGLTTAEREANYRWLAQTINAVAGTSFKVPGGAPDAGTADSRAGGVEGGATPDRSAAPDHGAPDREGSPPGAGGGGCGLASSASPPGVSSPFLWLLALLALLRRPLHREQHVAS